MKPLRIGIVGPCASGKTTLTAGLKQHGYDARPIAQEHSYVPHMWQCITNPDILIYLTVSYPLTLERRNLDWTETEYLEQLHRLRYAREHANLNIDTNNLTPLGVLDQALAFLEKYLKTLDE
jgi:deoxyadenosine/deoxycytidine kinase